MTSPENSRTGIQQGTRIMIRTTRRLGLTAAFALLPATAFAHAQGNHGYSLLHGLAHPVGGLDHLMAMVLVGVLAWQIGGRARWGLPLLFVSMMAVGGLLGTAGIVIPMFELGIALSVVVLGLLTAFDLRQPLPWAMLAVGLSAIFHGYAHGAEMPASANGLSYAIGFLLATALLHASGLVVGMALKAAGNLPARLLGGVAALAGIGLVLGAG
jgi:urease accessory protein